MIGRRYGERGHETLAWHTPTPNHFTYGSGVDSIHDVVCRIKNNPNVRWVLGDDLSRSAEGPLLPTIKIAVVNVDQLLEPAPGE